MSVTFENAGTSRQGKKYPHESLTRGEIEDMLATCTKGPLAARDHALITLFWRTGVRHDEALSMLPHSVTGDRADVLHGKGDKKRTVGLDARTIASIKTWKEERAKLKMPPTTPLFCTLKRGKGNPLDQGNIRKMLKSRARKAGILKRITPHSLRHALVVELMNEGKNLKEIQQVLGHERLSSTSVYTDTMNPLGGIEALQARE